MTYLYLREDGTEFEEWQRISDPPLTECPTTGQSCKRIIYKRKTPFGFKEKLEGTSYKGDDSIQWY